MLDQRTGGSLERVPPSEDVVDRAVLDHLLDRHPGVVTVRELTRALVDAPEEAQISAPAVSDGVRHLVVDGLAECVADAVVASRAAVRFYALCL